MTAAAMPLAHTSGLSARQRHAVCCLARKPLPLCTANRSRPLRPWLSPCPGGKKLTYSIEAPQAATSNEARISSTQECSPTGAETHSEGSSFPDWLFRQCKRGVAMAAVVLAAGCLAVAPALAARSGGRMGGSGFSAASSSGFGGSSFGSSGLSSRSGSSLGASWHRGSSHHRSGPGISLGFGSVLPVFYGGGYGTSGGGIGGVLIWVVAAAVLYGVVTSFLDNRKDDAPLLGAGSDRVSVIKLQVGLLGTARQMQRDLDRIAGRADTTTPSGLHYVLQETVLGLLRNPDQCIYGSAAVSSERSLSAGEDAFNRLSMEERGKFKEETLVNYGGRSRQQSYTRSRSNGVQELIVVTILVAVQASLKMPRVTSGDELRTALNRLGAVRTEQTLAVEVLWTPQDEGDYYTKDEVFADFPTLNNL